MKNVILTTTLLLALMALTPTGAIAQYWLDWEVAGIDDLEEWGSLFVLPNGEGKSFTEMFLLNGNSSVVDGTIIVTIKHGWLQYPIPGIPAEDLWLVSASEGLVFCNPGSAIAAAPTDADGRTWFEGTLHAGGYDTAGLNVRGQASKTSGIPIPIAVNSADIDGSGRVNLTDTGYFASDMFLGPYDYRSDFNGDGVINLTDAGLIGTNLGVSCSP